MSEAGANKTGDASLNVSVHDYNGEDDVRPPLPSRPNVQSTLQKPPRPQLQTTATTALSLTDIHTQSFQDGSREMYAAQAEPTSGRFLKGLDSIRRLKGLHGSEADSASVRSYAPTLETGGDVESLLGEVLGATPETPAWRLAGAHAEGFDVFEATEYQDEDNISDFDHEFDEMDELSADADNEGEDHRA